VNRLAAVASEASLLILSALVLSACSTPSPVQHVHFVSFEEPQRNWLTQPYGLVHLVDGFLVYGFNQLPPAPYEIRGTIYVSGADISGPDLEPAVVRTARQEGGEAALLKASAGMSGLVGVEAMEYQIIQFKTNGLAAVRERINLYLALNPGATNNIPAQEVERLRQHKPSPTTTP
jgi:hypothetical protein